MGWRYAELGDPVVYADRAMVMAVDLTGRDLKVAYEHLCNAENFLKLHIVGTKGKERKAFQLAIDTIRDGMHRAWAMMAVEDGWLDKAQRDLDLVNKGATVARLEQEAKWKQEAAARKQAAAEADPAGVLFIGKWYDSAGKWVVECPDRRVKVGSKVLVRRLVRSELGFLVVQGKWGTVTKVIALHPVNAHVEVVQDHGETTPEQRQFVVKFTGMTVTRHYDL